MKKPTPIAGQRWGSDSEPELGLGIVLKSEYDRAEIFFPAARENRHYALASAPIRRVQFQPGDTIKTHEGRSFVVESVEDYGGLLVYRNAQGEVGEAELSDLISFSKPEERLMAGQIDALTDFALRVECLQRRSAIRQSPVRGFAGGRVDLIPHQMSIAGEVASRLVPRVLLADEVGLGKTIEAGLILHRLHLTGRASRILILVPDALVNQWFVELFRRFHLLFSVFDEERCATLEAADANPFLDSQLVICRMGLLAGNPERAARAVEAGWDLLIVDEAHHLEWTPEAASPAYTTVEALAAKVPGLLLLTATPRQLGVEGHFARLRLLDPDRYNDLAAFVLESKHYDVVAAAVDRILEGKPLTKTGMAILKSDRLKSLYEAHLAGTKNAKEDLVAALLDEFGTGRVMFRNTRAALTGFPKRKAILVPLDKADDPVDARIQWLVQLLKSLESEKILLICKSRELAEDVAARLQARVKVSMGLFHEGLTLLQRDRNAAFFAEPEGARILVCSEIGSEGRNFQFAHHLVLFDLPDDPELLEQRIGRLDRIGQTETITIHVPFVPGTESEVLARWYHEGLDAFEHNLHGATETVQPLAVQRDELLATFDSAGLKRLVKDSQAARAKVTKILKKGHDRLLELHSCRADAARDRMEAIRALDADRSLEDFFLRILDRLRVEVADQGPRSYLLRSGSGAEASLPGLTPEGMAITLDRERALHREDLVFVTQDHPLVRGALDAFLGSETGNSAFGVWTTDGPGGIFLEIYACVECVAPPSVHADRFLPAKPIRVVVNQALEDCSDDEAFREAPIMPGDVQPLLNAPVVKKKYLPAMLAKALHYAHEKMRLFSQAAITDMKIRLDAEIGRLEDLRAINDHVRPQEIDSLREQRAVLKKALSGSRVRLDALKLVLRRTEGE